MPKQFIWVGPWSYPANITSILESDFSLDKFSLFSSGSYNYNNQDLYHAWAAFLSPNSWGWAPQLANYEAQGWGKTEPAMEQYLGFYNPEPITVTACTIQQGIVDSDVLVNLEMLGSNNGKDYTSLGKLDITSHQNEEYYTFTLPVKNNTPYSWYKFMTRHASDDKWVRISYIGVTAYKELV